MFIDLLQRPMMRSLLFFLLLSIVAVVYWPGLGGSFLLDDYPQLVANDALALPQGWGWQDLMAALVSSDSGPLGRPVAMATLALQRTLYGLDPWGFKLFNLGVHLVNAWLVFLLARKLFKLNSPLASSPSEVKHYYAALWVSAAWALHPYNLTGVLYVVQRMTSLSTAFSLLAILGYVNFRGCGFGAARKWFHFLSILAASLMAVLSKETALLIPVFCFIFELLFFRFEKDGGSLWAPLVFFYGALFIVPVLWFLFKFIYSPDWLSNMYLWRPFDLGERLGSEVIILWDYLRNIFVPDVNSMGLHHDDFRFFDYPISSPFVIFFLVAHIGVLLGCWLLREKCRLLAFGVFFFYSGHLLETTFWPLELIYEHRNYLPSIGISIMCGAMFLVDANSQRLRQARLAFGVLLLVFFAGTTFVRSTHWGDPLTFAMVEAEKHPNSGRANFDAGRELVVLMLRLKNPPPDLGKMSVVYLDKSRGKGMVTVEPYLVGYQGMAQLGLVLPGGFFEQFASQLREGYIPNGLYSLAQGLLSLSRFDHPPLSVENLEYLYEQCLMNPRVVGVSRGHILTAYSIFAAETQGDFAKAKEISRQAVLAAPDFIPFKQNAALMAYFAGDRGGAKRMLAEIEEQDKLGLFRRETIRLKSMLKV